MGAWKSVRLKHYPTYPIIIISLIMQRNLAKKIRAKRESSLTTVQLKRDPPVYVGMCKLQQKVLVFILHWLTWTSEECMGSSLLWFSFSSLVNWDCWVSYLQRHLSCRYCFQDFMEFINCLVGIVVGEVHMIYNHGWYMATLLWWWTHATHAS